MKHWANVPRLGNWQIVVTQAPHRRLLLVCLLDGELRVVDAIATDDVTFEDMEKMYPPGASQEIVTYKNLHRKTAERMFHDIISGEDWPKTLPVKPEMYRRLDFRSLKTKDHRP